MSFVQDIPAIVRILVVFICILVAIKKKISLGNAFFLGAILIGLLFGLKPEAMISSAIASVLMPKTLLLAVIVTLILVLSSSMEEGGNMGRLVENFRGLVTHSRLNLAMFPALIGLLPMPGGAIFSAPMVKELGSRSGLRPDQLSFINYWYRHIWEYWWPLYPGVLLAVTLAAIDLWVVVLIMWPLTVIAVSLGSLSIRGSDLKDAEVIRDTRRPAGPFVKELTPILIVICGGLGLGIIIAAVSPGLDTAKEIGLICALVLSILSVWFRSRVKPEAIRKILTSPHILRMFYMIVAILIFKGMLEDSRAVEAISGEFMALAVPLVLIVVVLPFIVGGITGITIAFVGSTFPIIIPLIQTLGEGAFMPAYVALALVSGFLGVLLSPLHLCLLLSNQYFDAAFGRVYRHLLLPCGVLLATGVAYFFFIHWLIA